MFFISFSVLVFLFIAAKVFSLKLCMPISNWNKPFGAASNILNVSSFNPLAEYYVICSVSSNRQALALAKYVDEVLAKNNIFVKHIEGNSTSEWILVDGIDYIIHLFLPDARIKYSLEKLYCDVDIIKVD